MLAVPVAADAAVLYDQTGSPAPFGNRISSNQFPTQPSGDDQAADDFTVPAGQQWTVDRVDVIGESFGGLGSSANVYLYASAGTLPGAELFRQTVSGVTPTNYSIPVGGAPALSPGTYWVSVQGVGGNVGQGWFWDDRAVQSQNKAAWRNPGGGQGAGCTSWTVRTSCTMGAAPDQLFKLSGTSSPFPPPNQPSNAFTLGKVKRNKKRGTATEPVVVPGPGTLTLGGTGVVPQRPRASAARAVSAAGTANLLVKAKGKAKKKLAKTGTAKVKVTITFTPTGGIASIQSRTIKLKRALH